MKTQKTKYLIFAAVITVAVIAGILIAGNGNNSKFKNQLKLGNEALLNMDYEGAIAAFANAIGLNPKDVEAYVGITKAFLALEDYSSASDFLITGYYSVPSPTILNMLEPLSTKELVALGKEFLSEGENSLAEDVFNEALKKDPANEEANKGLEDIKNQPDYDTDNDLNNDNSLNQDATEPDNNQNQTDINDNVTNDNALNFHPSDITFFGYPVTENHYEEWKSSLNFSGDDTDPTYGGDDNSDFCDKLICGNGTYANQGSSLKISLIDANGYVAFLNWDAQGTRYIFNLNSNSSWNHVAEQHVSGPFHIGQTFDDALQAAGYTGEISFDGTPTITSDNVTIVGTNNNGMNTIMFMFDQTQVQFSGSGNVISQIVVISPTN